MTLDVKFIDTMTEYISCEELSFRIAQLIEMYPMHQHCFLKAFLKRIPEYEKVFNGAHYGITEEDHDEIIGFPPLMMGEGPEVLVWPGFLQNIPTWKSCAKEAKKKSSE